MGGGINYQKVFTFPDSFYFDEQRGVYTKCLLNKVIFSPYVPMRDPIINERKFYDRIAKKKNNLLYCGKMENYMRKQKPKNRKFAMHIFFEENFM